MVRSSHKSWPRLTARVAASSWGHAKSIASGCWSWTDSAQLVIWAVHTVSIIHVYIYWSSENKTMKAIDQYNSWWYQRSQYLQFYTYHWSPTTALPVLWPEIIADRLASANRWWRKSEDTIYENEHRIEYYFGLFCYSVVLTAFIKQSPQNTKRYILQQSPRCEKSILGK